MAEFRYGYRTKFDEPTPVEEYPEPQFHKPNARVTASNPHAANLLSKLPLKDPTIAFNIDLQQNNGSDPCNPINAQKLFEKVSCRGLMIISILRFAGRLSTNATMCRETGARRSVYFNPQHR